MATSYEGMLDCKRLIDSKHVDMDELMKAIRSGEVKVYAESAMLQQFIWKKISEDAQEPEVVHMASGAPAVLADETGVELVRARDFLPEELGISPSYASRMLAQFTPKSVGAVHRPDGVYLNKNKFLEANAKREKPFSSEKNALALGFIPLKEVKKSLKLEVYHIAYIRTRKHIPVRLVNGHAYYHRVSLVEAIAERKPRCQEDR